MPTLLLKEISSCQGFSGTLKFQPKLGNQPVSHPISVGGNPATIHFNSGDRLFLMKVDNARTYETAGIPDHPVTDKEFVFKTPPGQSLRVRYSVS